MHGGVSPAPTRRIVLITLDGVGIGALPDAALFGDDKANTLLHVAESCGGLHLPNLQSMGLGNILSVPGVAPVPSPSASWGRMREASAGKDSTAGHWEIAGLIQAEPLPTYPAGFPEEIIDTFTRETGLKPLGNVAESGTTIIRRLGEEHLLTGRPIVYTSVDSVFQIAAHEDIIPINRLYEICRIARRILDPYRVGRVIARPFVGRSADDFARTSRRHDFSLAPTGETVLDFLHSKGVPVVGIGKIYDLFAGRGVAESIPTRSNEDGMGKILAVLERLESGVVFANLVDFDMLYGHRQDALGFGKALESFDVWLPKLTARLLPGDLLVMTADHGCDPTLPGTDHTREHVPLLVWPPANSESRELGVRTTFADVAATVAAYFGLEFGTGRGFFV